MVRFYLCMAFVFFDVPNIYTEVNVPMFLFMKQTLSFSCCNLRRVTTAKNLRTELQRQAVALLAFHSCCKPYNKNIQKC